MMSKWGDTIMTADKRRYNDRCDNSIMAAG